MPTATEEDHLEPAGALAEDAGRTATAPGTACGDGAAPADGELTGGTGGPTANVAVATALATSGAAVMVGGVFLGIAPRIAGAVAGLLGVGLALAARRIRHPAAANVAIVAGLFGIGLLLVVPAGIGHLPRLSDAVRTAAASGDVLRPPVGFTPGWQAIQGWLLGAVGFAACWVAVVVGRPFAGVLIPVPVAALAAISVPKTAQVASGIGLLALFAAALGVLSHAVELGQHEARPPRAYQLKRLRGGLGFIAVAAALLVGLSRTDVLFPAPVVNPAEEARKPRTQPLRDVVDRVLFEVESSVTGPWRLGSLDVYDGRDFRLAPFAQSQIRDVPSSGIVNDVLPSAVTATFTVLGLDGGVLPALPNTVGIVARGPRLAFDSRSGSIRLAEGQVTGGRTYTVAAAAIPKLEQLRLANGTPPAAVRPFTSIPEMPPAVRAKVDEVTGRFDSKWDRFDALRSFILENVVSTGVGAPTSVPPERVESMFGGGTQEGTPFEIVAAQALLARWVGVPARIGFGFDGGEDIGGRVAVRPKHGAIFVEVYFPGYEWIPVIGTPKQAKPTVGSDPSQQRMGQDVQPGGDLLTRLYVPLATPPPSVVKKQITQALLGAAAVVLLLAMLYALHPAIGKAISRARRRSAAHEWGPRARLAVAYADWRDLVTDYGYDHHSDTPLQLLQRFATDEEHTQLAWLVTRALWGDLQEQVGADHAAAAEELSRSLRRRFARAHPIMVRALAALSRLSVRQPYGSDGWPSAVRRPREVRHVLRGSH